MLIVIFQKEKVELVQAEEEHFLAGYDTALSGQK